MNRYEKFVWGEQRQMKPIYDLWLDKYRDILDSSRHMPVLDLGCGPGNDSLYLFERGYRVISCDISEKAIASVKAFVPDACTMVFDMREGLPFDDGSFLLVIADLCLHYFRWGETVGIVRDIRRVLKEGGVLLCRLNSTNDFNYGAGQGERIEENYYSLEGKTKRFFDHKQVEALFSDWDVHHACECCLERYQLPKMLWEIAVKKP